MVLCGCSYSKTAELFIYLSISDLWYYKLGLFVPVKLQEIKQNRTDVYVAYSLLIAEIALCPISILSKSLHLKPFTNLN